MTDRIRNWLGQVVDTLGMGVPPNAAIVNNNNRVVGIPAVGNELVVYRPRRPGVRPLDLDPYCTDVSFFGSGKFRPTAYAQFGDRDRAPNVVPRRDPRRGPYTGAARPDYPRVNRKFSGNTRQRVMPFRRYNHMHETGYDDAIVGSKPVPSFIPPDAALGQGGSEAVLAAAGLKRTLGPGSRHYLLDGSS